MSGYAARASDVPPRCHSERSASEVELRSSARREPKQNLRGGFGNAMTWWQYIVDPDAGASPFGFDCVLTHSAQDDTV